MASRPKAFQLALSLYLLQAEVVAGDTYLDRYVPTLPGFRAIRQKYGDELKP